MSNKPLIEQIGEGLKNAIGIETGTAAPKGKTIPVLKKLPTVKVPPTKEEKQAAYKKRRNNAILNKRLKNIEAAQKQKAATAAKRKPHVHSDMQKMIVANQKAIAELKRELAMQKRYADMLMKKWEAKNAKQLSKMTANFRDQLKQKQSQQFNAFARKKVQLRKSAPKKKAALAQQQATKPVKRIGSSRGRKSFTATKSIIRRPIAKRPALKPVARKIVSRPTVKRPVVRKPVTRRIIRKRR